MSSERAVGGLKGMGSQEEKTSEGKCVGISS